MYPSSIFFAIHLQYRHFRDLLPSFMYFYKNRITLCIILCNLFSEKIRDKYIMHDFLD